MNLILLFPEDFLSPTLIRLTDYRASHIREIHRAPLGRSLKVGKVHGGIGKGTVVALDGNAVELEVQIPDAIPETPKLSLILGMPRPQSLKKVLETIGAFGLKRLCLVNTERVQKSFFDSKLLQDRAWMRHLRLGMEQGGRTYLPEMIVQPNLSKVFEQDFAPEAIRIIAHPGLKNSLWDTPLANGQAADLVVAIGPEGGWLDLEVAAFQEKGFLPIQLGPTIHRVENAVTALLAQIEFLKMKNG